MITGHAASACLNLLAGREAGLVMLFYVIAILVVLLDQMTKHLIRSNVNIGDSLSYGWIRITHIENSGMAGGLFQGYGLLFGMAAVLFVIGVLYYRRTAERKNTLLDCSLGFLVGGAIGNGMDRLLLGSVTDFLVRSRGVLNLADHAIEMGILLFLVYSAINLIRTQSKAKR
jgi:signal peptidase II